MCYSLLSSTLTWGYLLVALAGYPPLWGQGSLRIPTYRIETVAGSPHNGDGGPATAAQISGIQGIAVDRAGNLYLSDTDNHRVRCVSPGGTIRTIAGTGLAGYSGDTGPAALAQLNLPYGLAVDAAGALYIADLGNNRVRRVGADGVITTVATGPLATPRNVAVDASGNLYIAEFDGHRVRRVSPEGTVVTVAGTGKAGFSGDGGPPDHAQLAYPAGVAIDRGGSLLIADSGNNRVRRIFAMGTIGTVLGGSSATALATAVAVAADPLGTIYAGDATPVVRSLSLLGKWSDVAGGASAGFSGDGGPATRASLSVVRDLVVDASGNLYIADGSRVRRVDAGGIITTVAGDGYVHVAGDGGPARDAVLSRPSAVASDGAGGLTIADTGTGRVRQVSSSGVITTLASGLSGPMGVATDAGGTVYFAETGNNAIRAVGSNRIVFTVTNAARGPRGVCLSRVGVLYATDTGNGRVIKLGAGVEVAAGQLSAPEACALDSSGNLYIAETGGQRVRKLSAAGELSTVAGAEIASPRGVAVDNSGNVYIADTGGNRIRVVTPDGILHTIAGTGEAGFTGDGGVATGARLNAPAGLFLDGAGAVYFADSGNDRVRRLVPDASLAVPSPAIIVTNALSGAAGEVAAGEIVSLTGAGIASGVEVRFDGVSAPVWFVSPGQITTQIPYAPAGGAVTHVEARLGSNLVGAADIGLVAASPGLFGVGVNEDGWLNSDMRPAARGSLVILLATGEGRTGQPVGITVAGEPAEVVRTESSAGILVVVVRMPSGFVATGEAKVVLTVGTARSNGIGVWLR